jgi:hypothetical protein
MGFADRINDSLRGAKSALVAAEVRQRQLEAEHERDALLRRLGVLAFEASRKGVPLGEDSDVSGLCRQIEELTQRIDALQREIDSAKTAGVVASPVGARRYCPACGAGTEENAAYCGSCGAPIR